MTDTSTQAVGAIASKIDQASGQEWIIAFADIAEAAMLLRALAEERDELAEMLNATGLHLKAARRTALEDAAKVCDRRAFYAFAKCARLGPTDPTTGIAECSLEVNGHDCLCQQAYEDAEDMARAIRALIEKEQK